jgi:hypothetical protein
MHCSPKPLPPIIVLNTCEKWGVVIRTLTYRTLTTTSELADAMFRRSAISVWQHDRLLACGDGIEHLSKHEVTVSGSRYLRAHCEFKILVKPERVLFPVHGAAAVVSH